MSPKTAAAFARGDAAARAKQYLYWNTKKLAKLVGGEAYLRLREFLVREK